MLMQTHLNHKPLAKQISLGPSWQQSQSSNSATDGFGFAQGLQ